MSYALQDAVWEISGISAVEKIVLLRLAHHARTADDPAFPSQQSIAESTGLCIRAVRNTLKGLERKGYIKGVRAAGEPVGAFARRWLLVFANRHEMPLSETPNRHDVPLSNRHLVPLSDAPETPNRHLVPVKAASRAAEPIKEHIEEERKEDSPPPLSPPVVIDVEAVPEGDGFAEFYAAYPRHEGKGAARKAYLAARKRASAAEILFGARRYTDARRGQEPRYTKMPATWLNADCWTDEPAPATGQRMGSNGKPMTEFNAMFLDKIEEAQRRTYNQR